MYEILKPVFHCWRSSVTLYCMEYGVRRSGRVAEGRPTCVGPPTADGKTRGKITVGAVVGFVKLGSLITNGAAPSETVRGMTSKKIP